MAGENIVNKAIKKPAFVNKVVDHAASHGLMSTVELVRARIANEMASGYSCAGVVETVGEGVTDLHVGERAACVGAGYANPRP